MKRSFVPLNWIQWLTLALCVVMAVTIPFIFHRLNQAAQEEVQTHRAACAYQTYLRDQARASENYLKAHPDGAPALGLSAAAIQRGIDKERAAAEALNTLHCTN